MRRIISGIEVVMQGIHLGIKPPDRIWLGKPPRVRVVIPRPQVILPQRLIELLPGKPVAVLG